MKYLSNKYPRKLLAVFLLCLMIANCLSPYRVYAEEACSEARLRDLKIAILSCEEDSDTSCDINKIGTPDSPGETYVPWNSNLDPPYIMEQFVIEVLKYIADFKKVPVEDVVTQEHVLAMLAWAWGEGGDIMNRSTYNLYNSGALRNDPGAMPYANGGVDGRQAYANFDTGIKATGGNILGGGAGVRNRYSRVWQALIDKNTSASDVLYAYTHYSQYEENSWWAQQNELDGEDAYYNKMLGFLNGFINDYGRAATLIGTDAKEQQTGERHPEKLFFDGTGSQQPTEGGGSGSGGGSGCKEGSSVGSGTNAEVVAVAEREFAAGISESGNAYHKYTENISQSWCAWFVSWVFREAGRPFTGGSGDGGYAYPSTDGMRAMAEANGWFHLASEAGFTPQPGDVAIYKEGVGDYPNHVNIVVSYDSAKRAYIAIGGNESNSVRKQEHLMTSQSLTGFMRMP